MAEKREKTPTVQAERPLSPHLTIYRWQITMSMSILHRATGAFLVLGIVMISVWILAAAHGAQPFNQINTLFSTLLGRFVLLGWLAAFYYHLLNGIRHLFWDMGYGFTLKVMEFTGCLVLLAAGLLTAATWILALY